MQKNISFYEAIDFILKSQISLLGREKVVFSDALGRVLAQDIIAKSNMPKFPTSSMDGYAFCFADFPRLLSEGLFLDGDNPAGADVEFSLKPASAIKTFTGSRMPKNSDTILLVEYSVCKEGKVFLSQDAPVIKKGDWVRCVGENYCSGDVLLKRGDFIGAYEIGLLADLNEVFVEVFRKPKVAILTGGSEIIEVGENRDCENMIYSVNNHLLKAMVTSMGGEGILYPIMPDKKETIKELMSEAFRDCDILLSTGGMSMGDYDFTQQAIAELCEVVFKGVRIKPGKPFGYALYHQDQKIKHLLALPGSPNSAALSFYLFGSVVFAKMFGITYEHQVLKAILSEDVIRTDSRMEFRVCDLEIFEGRYYANFSKKRIFQSSVINNLCGKSALVILQENGENLHKGDEVDMIIFKNFL
ncbi:molybdopterin molybdotransferase MoeA [Helicobacter cappadocius]|uniref:Molybdopterin molybdenumtransferase n=1 Tax=Helicobacter cappadocius TaxID=3063998 RepID=A0AA90SSZ6_9HELI|nr:MULTISPECIES: molybdopterin molybdotransferase MoeA [unclassified Helicobacter]MDO7253551.1 molybdopterin molybdotransferase MoeA [Helicobacter sp. faydin-H75]MDP2539479.1 molybdopterin molybdotransferase MoeA [Helicobacter sp. faydin-H76]